MVAPQGKRKLGQFLAVLMDERGGAGLSSMIGRRYDDPIKAMVPYHIVPRGNGDAWVEVIRLVVMMYVGYALSLRNVEDLLAERGIGVGGCGHREARQGRGAEASQEDHEEVRPTTDDRHRPASGLLSGNARIWRRRSP